MFHISQLKKKLGLNTQVHNQVPSHIVEIIKEPDIVLDRRMVNRSGKATTEVLVKWKQLPLEEATWENYWELIKKFPVFDLETRSISRGEH